MNACCSLSIGVARVIALFGAALLFFNCSDAPRRDYGSNDNSFAGDCLSCHAATPTDADPAAIAADIIDTHYDDLQWLPDGAFNTAPTEPLEGYILESVVPWAPETMGYVTRANPSACAASCHDRHRENLATATAWFASRHALITDEPFTHTFTSGVCMRCHSGVGFAAYVDASNQLFPDWAPPTTDRFPHHITCNACHDAQGYPSADAPRLRLQGALPLTSGGPGANNNFVVDRIIDVGRSTTCFVCHQGRESGKSVYRALVNSGVDPLDGIDDTLTGRSFLNPHYLPVGAMLLSLKGYEYAGMQYTLGNKFHQSVSCLGCHGAPSDDLSLGGHSYNMRNETGEHLAPCAECHGDVEGFGAVGLMRDLDGDGVFEYPKAQLETLVSRIVEKLEADGIYFNPHVHPYFFNTADPAQQVRANAVREWRESQLEAAFNVKFVSAEHGAYVHNFVYAAQLLLDSYENLTGTSLTTLRPSQTDQRWATDYTQ